MLIPSDEGFNHQITDTFASVSQSDPSWTEKVCGTLFSKDGSLQISWGMGKYINRNVMDAFAGVSKGVEQWTVRSSRMLFPSPDQTSAGPIHYEVIEPLKKIRLRLEKNEHQPIAFDVILDCSAIPPFLENHEFRRQVFGFRTETDLCRYHQVGRAEGWMELNGERHEITPDNWFATRDHSWGVRYDVGERAGDIMPGIDSSDLPLKFLWSPMQFPNPGGAPYSLHHFFLDINMEGYEYTFHGGKENHDGSRIPFSGMTPKLSFDPDNRRLKGGTLEFQEEDGTTRNLEIAVISETGFHLGAGLYFGYKGQHHGSWRGELHVEGDYIQDCSLPEVARDLHQIRDCIIQIDDNGVIGYGNYQTIVNGAWEDLGLSAESSFI
jgi:hypothetical protein